jgi:hypothetical protein
VDGSQRMSRAVHRLLQQILASRQEAAAYAADPAGYLRARGIVEDDLVGTDPVRLVRQACCYVRLPPVIAPGHTGHEAEPLPPSPFVEPDPDRSTTDRLARCISYVALVSYRGDTYLTSRLAGRVDGGRSRSAPTSSR